MKNCIIYDFETLSKDPETGVVLSMAIVGFDIDRFAANPYTFEDLIEGGEASKGSKTFKFDVKEQVSVFGRKIQKDTLEWWSSQGEAAKAVLKPSSNDISITLIEKLFTDYIGGRKLHRVFTRGNSFDPVFLSSLLKATGNKEPYSWWNLRDTRSFIEGLSFGADLNNDFIPPDFDERKFIKHDPAHDIALDVLRIQYLVRALG